MKHSFPKRTMLNQRSPIPPRGSDIPAGDRHQPVAEPSHPLHSNSAIGVTTCTVLATALMLVSAYPLNAEESSDQSEAKSSVKKSTETKEGKSPPTASTVARYKPPVGRGAPRARTGGGTRGTGDSQFFLSVLTPDHVGLTTQEQPSLFWYQSKPAVAKFELTVTEEQKIKPLLDLNIEQTNQAGIQRLRLSDHQIKLSPDTEYQWVVAVVLDAKNRSKDVVASGYIKRVAPSEALSAKLESASKSALPNIYAEEGIWYDALEALSDLIDAQPDEKTLRKQRAALLRQEPVGLINAAAYDEKMASVE